MPKLSVITINFNDLNGLEKTIKSVISQTFTDLEFIVIDGASSDGSIDVIKKYAAKITSWVSEKDTGIYNAQNKGTQKATGEYCLFLNSGDFLVDENVLKNIFSKNRSEDIIYGNMMIDFGNGKIKLGRMPDEITNYQLYKDTLWHPVSFIKRVLFEKYGQYDEQYKIVADYEFFCRTIIKNKVSTHHIALPVTVFAHNGTSSLSENKPLEKAERKKVQKIYFSVSEIAALEEQLKANIQKEKKLLNRIINKLKK